MEFLIANSGRAIPSDAAIDEHGQPTHESQRDSSSFAVNPEATRTDAAAGLQGAQLPFAGHKVRAVRCKT